MIISRKEIISLWKKNRIKFKPDIDENQISLCSIDLRLGTSYTHLIDNPGISVTPSISTSAGLFKTEKIKDGDKMRIPGNSFRLTTTYEKITLPNDLAAFVEGRSTYARWGLSTHTTAPFINPGWNGQIALELFNHNKVELNLQPIKDRVCQLILFRISKPIEKSAIDILSRYKGQTTPTPTPYDNS